MDHGKGEKSVFVLVAVQSRQQPAWRLVPLIASEDECGRDDLSQTTFTTMVGVVDQDTWLVFDARDEHAKLQGLGDHVL